MKSSDRRIVAARKLEDETLKRGERNDTLPAPPPSSAGALHGERTTDNGEQDEHGEDGHDTIPTPAPESGITDVIVIPPHRPIDFDEER